MGGHCPALSPPRARRASQKRSAGERADSGIGLELRPRCLEQVGVSLGEAVAGVGSQRHPGRDMVDESSRRGVPVGKRWARVRVQRTANETSYPGHVAGPASRVLGQNGPSRRSTTRNPHATHRSRPARPVCSSAGGESGSGWRGQHWDVGEPLEPVPAVGRPVNHPVPHPGSEGSTGLLTLAASTNRGAVSHRARGIVCETHLGMIGTDPARAHAWVTIDGVVLQSAIDEPITPLASFC